MRVNSINIGFRKRKRRKDSFSWSSYWKSLISATVETAEPTKVVLTFSSSISLPSISKFSLVGKTISEISLDVTSKILTLTVTVAYAMGDEIGSVFYTQGSVIYTYPVVNNINTLTDGLQVYWKLDEASGTRAATVGGLDLAESAATVGTDTINVIDAAQFNVEDGKWLTHADNALLRGGNSDFTFAALVKIDSVHASYSRGILGKYSVNREYQLYFAATTNQLSLYVSSDGTNGAGKLTLVQTTNWTPLINTEYLVFAWHDSVNDKIGVQINNFPPITNDHAGGVYGYTNAFQVGAVNGASFMDGKIALVAKWSKVLTDGEKKALYNNAMPLVYPFTRDMNLLASEPRIKVVAKGDGTDAKTASRLNHQRNVFYASGRYWLFYTVFNNTTPYNIYVISTADGITWVDPVLIDDIGYADAQYDVRYDGTHVHVAKNIQKSAGALVHDGLEYRRGTPNIDGTITWDADWQTVLATGNYAGDICLMITSDGFAAIGYGNEGSAVPADGDAIIIKNSVSDGTWSTAAGFPVNLTNTDTANRFTTITPLLNGGIYATVNGWGVEEKITGYYSEDGGSTFNSDGEISLLDVQGLPEQYVGTEEILSVNGVVHLAYYSNTDKVMYRQRSVAGIWSDETQLSTTGDTEIYTTCPRLSVDTDGTLYVFWGTKYAMYGCKNDGTGWTIRKKIIDSNIDDKSIYSHLMTVERFEKDKFSFTTLLQGSILNHYIMDVSNL